jgi:hypothetical protein
MSILYHQIILEHDSSVRMSCSFSPPFSHPPQSNGLLTAFSGKARMSFFMLQKGSNFSPKHTVPKWNGVRVGVGEKFTTLLTD